MNESRKPRLIQLRLRDMFLATFWIAVACASAMMSPIVTPREGHAPIWTVVAVISLVAACWTFAGRYYNVLVTAVYAIAFFLLMFWLHKESILG